MPHPLYLAPLIERDAVRPYLDSIAMPLTLQVTRPTPRRRTRLQATTASVWTVNGTRRGNSVFDQALDAAFIGATGGFPGEVFA